MELEKRDEIPFRWHRVRRWASSETVIRPATEMDALPKLWSLSSVYGNASF